MSKLLIALLALDIGVSLSKVYIFAWKSNYLSIKKKCICKKEKDIRNLISSKVILYK